MKTIQMTIDENLLRQVDEATKKIKTSRSEFIRRALKQLLNILDVREMEKSHREGYQKFPVKADEFSAWENEQSWV